MTRMLMVVVAVACLTGFSAPSPMVPAFPGAEGFAAMTPGGRGGSILLVTNLNDSGAGSLRAACEASGPRTVIFKTGGTIQVTSPISLRNPYITIAGQTAPGGGICVSNAPGHAGHPFVIQTSDVIIRGMRFRAGGTGPAAIDSVNLSNGDRVILDHCSISWSTDENIGERDSWDLTIQWCVISEALRASTNPEGAHSKGMRTGGNARFTKRVTVHHNLFAHNDDRNPLSNGVDLIDVRNNVIYNFGHATQVNDVYAVTYANIEGNYYKNGPNTNASEYAIDNDVPPGSGLGRSIYVKGNISGRRPNDSLPETADVHPIVMSSIVTTPAATAPVTTHTAFEAYDLVLAGAGATLPTRDSADLRVVNDVINGTGAWVDDPSQVGGYPVLAAGTPLPDGDSDGMPDAWETANGLDPANPLDAILDLDGDGYTNIEEYMNDLFSGGSAPPPPASEPSSGGGGSGHSACGLLGVEVILVLGMILIARR